MRRLLFFFVLPLAALAIAGCSAKYSTGDADSSASPSASSPATPDKSSDASKGSDALMVLTGPVLSDDKTDIMPKEKISKDAGTIYLLFQVQAPVGTKVKTVWTCVESPGIEPNYKIDEAIVEIEEGDKDAEFTISRPTNGWPVGKYHAEVFFDDQPMGKFEFTIE